jgi:hypothetical protein
MRPMTKKTKQKPIDAKTEAQIIALNRDNISYGTFWALIDGPNIHIKEQPRGELPVQAIKISRRAFDRIARWYMTGSPDKQK